MLKRFTAAISANRHVNERCLNVACYVSIAAAVLEETALGMFLMDAWQRYPQEDGWQSHDVTMMEIPADWPSKLEEPNDIEGDNAMRESSVS